VGKFRGFHGLVSNCETFPPRTICNIWYFKIITSIKIVSLQDQIFLLLQLGDRDISRLTSSLHLQSLLMHTQTFYLEVESFTKNGDKFGWVKYWRMTFNLPKFSPVRILCFMVIIIIQLATYVICDCLSKNIPSSHNSKYLEIPI